MDKIWQQWDTRYLAILASLALSLFSAVSASLPNDDAYTYLRTAEIFLHEGTSAAIGHYTWAGYPILIGILSLTGLSLLHAAYALNALFYALLVFSFVSIVQRLSDSKTIGWLAALTVLTYPELNEYRDMVIRDVGYWSLSLYALWHFMLFVEARKLPSAGAFIVLMLAAAVFRAEALIYLAAMPFTLLFSRETSATQNRKDFSKLMAMIVGAFATGFLALLVAGINLLSMLMEVISVYSPFLISLFNPEESVQAAQATAIFGEFAGVFSREYVSAVIAVGLLVVLAMTLFYTIGGPYFWLLVYGLGKRHIGWQREKLLPLLAVALVNLLILVVFLYLTRFLTGRYAMLTGIMVATQIPFLVTSIVDRYKDSKWQQLSRNFLILFFFYCLIDAHVSFGRSKDWLLEAAAFVKNEVPSDAPILTNNRTIAYFSGRIEEYDLTVRDLRPGEILEMPAGSIIALEMYYGMSSMIEQSDLRPYLRAIESFPDGDSPQVTVFERISP